MNKLIAKKGKAIIEVIKENDKIKVLVDDKESDFLKDYLEFKGENLSIGGTYYPEKNTLLFFYLALTELEYNVEIEGDLEVIPHEDGFIY